MEHSRSTFAFTLFDLPVLDKPGYCKLPPDAESPGENPTSRRVSPKVWQIAPPARPAALTSPPELARFARC